MLFIRSVLPCMKILFNSNINSLSLKNIRNNEREGEKMKNSLEQIKRKYNLKKDELLLHYVAIGEEVSIELMRELGIDKNSQNYITLKGRLKGCFIYRKTGKIRGYQITRKGANEAIERNENYKKYLINNTGIRNTTNNVARRTKMQKKAKLYYYLDVLGISYIENENNRKEAVFYEEKFIKKNETSDEIKHAMISSRNYGIIKFNEKDIYILYVFDNEISNLKYNIEARTISSYQEIFDTDESKGIIITKDKEIQSKLIKGIMEAYLEENPKKLIDKYKAYNYLEMNELHIINFAESGIIQMELLEKKEKVDQMIKEEIGCVSEQEAEKMTEKDNIICDGRTKSCPCEFLYSLDVMKIKRMYDEITNREYIAYNVVCLKEQEELIMNIFEEVLDYITIYTIEELEIKKKLDIDNG